MNLLQEAFQEIPDVFHEEQVLAEHFARKLSVRLPVRVGPILDKPCEGNLDTDLSAQHNCHWVGIRKRDRLTSEMKSGEEIAYIVGHEMIHAHQIERDRNGDWRAFFKDYEAENDRNGYVANCYEVEARKRGLELAAEACGIEELKLRGPWGSEVYCPQLITPQSVPQTTRVKWENFIHPITPQSFSTITWELS